MPDMRRISLRILESLLADPAQGKICKWVDAGEGMRSEQHPALRTWDWGGVGFNSSIRKVVFKFQLHPPNSSISQQPTPCKSDTTIAR
jgi:hypothetical protein